MQLEEMRMARKMGDHSSDEDLSPGPPDLHADLEMAQKKFEGLLAMWMKICERSGRCGTRAMRGRDWLRRRPWWRCWTGGVI